MVEWKVRSVGEAGVHVMGRVTYEQMAAHWASSNLPFKLVDELRVVLWPVIAGDREGDRWFGDLAEPQSLRMVDSTDFPDGSGVRAYRPAGRPQW